MNKVRALQIIFIIVEVFAAIPLTAEVFGDMDPAVMSVSAIVIWVGLLGNMVCAIIRAAHGSKKE